MRDRDFLLIHREELSLFDLYNLLAEDRNSPINRYLNKEFNPNSKTPTKRNVSIIEDCCIDGLNYTQIASKHGITTGRISRIIKESLGKIMSLASDEFKARDIVLSSHDTITP